jgi:hypothetical protein
VNNPVGFPEGSKRVLTAAFGIVGLCLKGMGFPHSHSRSEKIDD